MPFRKFKIYFVTISLFFISTQNVESCIFWTTESEELHRIQSTKITDPNGEYYDIGYKTTVAYAYSILGMWVANDGYVLIPKYGNKTYYPVTISEIEQYISKGLLSEKFSTPPVLPFSIAIKGISAWFILIFILVGVLINYLWQKKKNKEALNTFFKLEEIDSFDRYLLEIMGLMSYADGNIDDQEVKAISKIFYQITKRELSLNSVRFILNLLDKNMSIENYIAALPIKLDNNQKELLIRGAYLIAISDNKLSNSEEYLVRNLSRCFNYSKEEMMSIINAMSTMNCKKEKKIVCS